MIKKALKKVKQTVTKCDLFSNTQLLRYGEEPQYKSANGGLCSISVLIAFIAIFTNTVLSTLDMTNISSTTTFYQEVDPSQFTTTSSGFLFAIGITNFNLTNPSMKYFNIEFSQKISNPKSSTSYTLVPCSREAWVSAYPNSAAAFDRQQLSSWLCLPPNTTLNFQGKYTSDVFQYVKIGVKACSATAQDNRTCANQSYIDSIITKYGPISFNYYFINTIINSNDQEYLGNYLEDTNYFTFTMQTGMTANIFISAYDIQSDTSLLPTTNIQQDTGGIVYEPTQNFVQEVNSGNPYYIQLYIRKSSLSISISRSFYKFADCLSYIGGLFSAIMVALFFMLFYNEYGYQVAVTAGVFKQTSTQKIKSQHFNVFTYLAYIFYCVIHFLGAKPDWKLLKQFDAARQQISKQLNIKLILKKIVFLQNCMNFLFEDFQLKCLHLKDKISLGQAAKNRKMFSFRKRLLKLAKKRQIGKEKQTQIQKQSYTNPFKNKSQSVNQQQNKFQQFQRMDFANDTKVINWDKGKVSGTSLQINSPIKALKYRQSQLQNINQTDIGNQDLSQSQESISSQSQKSEDQFYEDIVNSMQTLQFGVKQGKERCTKIYNSLDPAMKRIAEMPQKQERIIFKNMNVSIQI